MLARDFRKKAWEALRGKWGFMALATLVYSLIVGVVNAIPAAGQVAFLVVAGPMYLGLTFLVLAVLRGGEQKIETLFDGFKDNKFLPAFLLQLLNGLFVALWSLLLVIPGIVKYYAYSMSTFIMADHPEMSQSECRLASMRMMQGNKWRLFCLHFSFIGWLLLSSLTFGILLFWVLPYMHTAEAAFYEDLKAKTEA